ncbi:hypothetical protein G9P44_001143 [Scheffersomyces stipitis]|nr:hypothetical protein G9P44_001143 [Scheffersomyces stipitis]
MSKTTVFITGATGFVAQNTIVELLSRGYSVVGSVRSEEKGEKLKTYFGDNFQYVVVAGFENKGAFDVALKQHPEVTVFLHTASPVSFGTEDLERDVLIPAIEGTRNALQSVHEHAPQVKRVVITSSAVTLSNFSDVSDPKFKANEDLWYGVTYEEGSKDPSIAYTASKVFAEKAAWEFVETNKPNFSLSTILPPYVFGPQAQDESAKGQLNISAEFVAAVYRLSKIDKVPEVFGPFVDVRDVAKAHVIAFENDEAKGKRIITYSGRFHSQTILNIIRDNFADLRDKLPVGIPSNGDVSESVAWDDQKSKKILGFEFIDIEKTVIDTVNQLIRANK